MPILTNFGGDAPKPFDRSESPLSKNYKRHTGTAGTVDSENRATDPRLTHSLKSPATREGSVPNDTVN